MASVRVIRRMRHKDGNAQYQISSGHTITVQYNHEENTSTTTYRYYRRIEPK